MICGNKCICSTCTCLQEAKRATSDYWRTPPGISRRIEMLSEYLTYKVVNNSLMFFGYSADITHVRWVTMRDERVCPICGESLFDGEQIQAHHKKPIKEGGKDIYSNLQLLHMYCHQQVHSRCAKVTA